MLFPGVRCSSRISQANALSLLARYRDRYLCFNDDIQGTGAVALGGLLNAWRLTGRPARDQRILFLGAGEAALGIGEMVASHLEREGLSPVEAWQRCWFMNSRGLVVRERADLAAHLRPFAHEHPPIQICSPRSTPCARPC